MDRSDQQLVAAYLSGERRAFDILVTRYLRLVYSVTLYYAKNTADAEDLSQDVFIKTMRHLKRYDPAMAFKPWILRIARNHSLDWVKKKKPFLMSDLETEEGENLLETIVDHAPLPDELAKRRETLDELDRVLCSLSPKDRLVIQLRYLKELSFREIAGELGEALDTVKSRARRALLKLRKSFEPKNQIG